MSEVRCQKSRHRNYYVWYLTSVFCFLPLPALALDLQLPLKCDIGKDCFIQNYVDESQTAGQTVGQTNGEYKDYKCGQSSFSHNKGTDFRLPDFVKMREGVDVLAAADGKVARIHDGAQDADPRKAGAAKPNDSCGNRVVITHADGWETEYCHLKRGAISVKTGQTVKTGEKLGEIGLSGGAEFPHLSFLVRHDGKTIDPFTGVETGYGCNIGGTMQRSLWSPDIRSKLGYDPTALLSSGFADGEPTAENARDGKYRDLQFPPDAKLLTFWADIMGVQSGDQLLMEIVSPTGYTLLSKQVNFPQNEATQFYYIGQKLMMNDWLPGTYKGRVSLLRQSPSDNGLKPVFKDEKELKVEKPELPAAKN